MPAAPAPLDGLAVFERGWLSSNNILIHAAAGEAGAVLVDTSHVNHAAQTVALVRHGLAGRPLERVVNTHLHSDHCGGNAALQRAFDVPVTIPPGLADAVQAWDEGELNFGGDGHRMERFAAQQILAPGGILVAGGREWQALAAPGHDPHSLILFDAANGVLISADALWEQGFGIVFPELAGQAGFDDVGAVFDLIESLPVKLVIPGHGKPFTDVQAALARSRARLAAFKADPGRHARHAVKVLIKYQLMQERSLPLAGLLQWAVATPMLALAWQRHQPAGTSEPTRWVEGLIGELVAGGTLGLRDGLVSDI